MGIIKKIAIGLCLILSPAYATESYEGEHRGKVVLVVPQKVGGGTSVWASIVAKELEKYLGQEVVLDHHPSARDIGGFNKFHEAYQFLDNHIMVSHGGNGVSFLTEEVKYNYADYDSIGLMKLNILVAKRKDSDMKPVKFAAGSGQTPEAYAIAMLMCGPGHTVQGYITCFENKVNWVHGMSGGERRLAFRRGELNGTRENPAAYKKHVSKDENAEMWFHHGVLDNGVHRDDPNHIGYQFEELYFEKWGKFPQGDFYDAYVLLKSFRDGMQKALWVRKGNPNRDRYVEALNDVASNLESIAAITEKVGDYDWYTGDWGNEHRDFLMGLITPEALNTMVTFNREALGLKTVYKENLVD